MLGVKKAPPAPDVRWQTETGGHVISLEWSPGGTQLAAATADGAVVVLDEANGQPLRLLSGHAGGTAKLAWRPRDPGGATLATAGCDGRARLWNAATGEELAVLEAGSPWVEHVAWSPDGRFLATGAGRELRLWDPEGRLVHAWPSQPSTIADLAWQPGVNVLASCGYNGLRFWVPGQETAQREFPWKGSMLKLAWSPDGKYIATGNQDATIQFWMIASGKELQMWGYRAKIRELAWDARSRYLASGGSATVVVWDCSGKGPAGSKPGLLEFHGALLTQLAFQSEGSMLASGCGEGLFALWRPGKEKNPLATAHFGSAVTQLAWAPGNQRCAVGTAGGQVVVVRA